MVCIFHKSSSLGAILLSLVIIIARAPYVGVLRFMGVSSWGWARWCFPSFLKKYLFIYLFYFLAAPRVSCGTRDR